MNRDELQTREWNSLYEALSEVLARFGREDEFGEGDYWLIDDNYGSPQHKVCVQRASFFTREMATAIQGVLRGRELPWEVIVAFDDRDPRRHPDDWGISVREANIEEHWAKERIRAAYGKELPWD